MVKTIKIHGDNQQIESYGVSTTSATGIHIKHTNNAGTYAKFRITDSLDIFFLDKDGNYKKVFDYCEHQNKS